MTATKKEPASLRFLTPEDEAYATGKKPAADAAPLSLKAPSAAAPSTGYKRSPASLRVPEAMEAAIYENVNRIEEASKALEAVIDALEVPQVPEQLKYDLRGAARLLVHLCLASARAIADEISTDAPAFTSNPQERGA